MKAKSKLLKASEFQFGDVEMTDDEYLLAQNPKIRTTIFLEADLIRAYKQLAAKKGLKYQALMREKLREAILGEGSSIEARLKRVEDQLFKKRA